MRPTTPPRPAATAADATPVAERELDLLEYWHILLERRGVVLGCFGVVLALGALLTLLATPFYRAVTTLQIERQGPDILTFKDVMGADPGVAAYQDFYQTEYRILRSRAVLRRAAEHLDLPNRPEFVSRKGSPLSRLAGWARSRLVGSGSAEDPLAPALRFLEARLDISPIRNSHLVEVGFTDRDPELARDVANAVAAAYQEFNLASRYDTTEQASTFLTKEVMRLQKEIADLERELQQYGTAKEILALSDGTQDISEQALGDLNRRQVEARGRLALARARYDAVQGADPSSLEEVLENPLIGHLKQQYADAEREYSQKAERFGPDWPAMLQLREELRQIEERLRIEEQSIARHLVEVARSNYQQAEGEVRRLEEEVALQKREVQRVSRDAIDYASLKSEIDTRRGVLRDLVARRSQTETSEQLRGTSASNIRVVDEAEMPDRPIRPRKALNLLISLFLGSGLGVAMAFVRHYLDNSVKTEQDIARYAQGIPVLGHVPILEGFRLVHGGPEKSATEPRPNPDMASHHSPRSAFSEAFRSLRTSLLLASPERPPRRIVVTSCEPGDGKTTAAINLSIVLTQMGKRVLLIDADLRRPSIHRAMGLPKTVGLSSILSGNADFEEAVVETEVPNLRVITSGPPPPNPSELLDSASFDSLLERLVDPQRWDHVVIDTPPALHMADSVILGTKADTTILVVRSGATSRESLVQGVARLRQARIKLAGAVLNAVSERRGYYSRYYYRYKYYQSEEMEQTAGAEPASSRRRRGIRRRA